MSLTDEEFQATRDLLLGAAGLVFDESRRSGLASVLAERLRATSAPDVAAYLSLVSGSDGDHERQRLLDAVTVQETHFFRNPPQLDALRRRVLPELLRRAAGRARPLTIWSAGCSTGEEPYTLAMLLLDLAPAVGHREPPRIVATDVSEDALRGARRATYTGRSVDAAPAIVQERWFEPRPSGALAVRAEARNLVELRLHNLVTEPPPFGPGEVDLVVCRNVTIYFSRDTTRALIGSFHDVLAEGGYLLLGHSETLWQVSDAFTLVPVGEAFVYRRTHDARRSVTDRVAAGAGERSTPGARPVRRRVPRPPAPRAAAATPATLLETARAALAAGDYERAGQAAEQAAAAEPLLAAAYVVRGQALATLGRDAAAVDPLRKAVYLDPSAGHAHFLLGGALARLGQAAQAAASYRAAAVALPGVDRAALVGLLGGRGVAELVDLCRRLADQCEGAAAGGPGRSAPQLTAGRSGS